MPKQIIILETRTGQGGDRNVTYAFWVPVTAGQQMPSPGYNSPYRAITMAELMALQSGATIERIYSTQYPGGWSLAQIQNDLITRYNGEAAQLAAQQNPNQYYGQSYDGTSWAAAGFIPARTTRFISSNQLLTTIGDTPVVSATPNQAISVYRLLLIADGVVGITIKDGSTALLGPFTIINGGLFNLLYNEEPWFVTTMGAAFNIGLSVAVNVSARVWYVKA